MKVGLRELFFSGSGGYFSGGMKGSTLRRKPVADVDTILFLIQNKLHFTTVPLTTEDTTVLLTE